jgi:hypothetical protein
MKHTLLLSFAITACLLSQAFAQTYGPTYSTRIILKNGNKLTILPPPFAADFSMTLPNANASGVLTNDGAGALSWAAAGAGWATNGNALTGTLPSSPTEFFGSSNGADVVMKTNGVEQLRLRSAGGLNIPVTTAAGVGVIYQDGIRFIHSSGGYSNFFAGTLAGNLSTTGTGNTGTGNSALPNITTGTGNTALGNSALVANTTGASNTAVGASALFASNGINNTAVGVSSLIFNSSGGNNSGFGMSALQGTTTGGDNTAVGSSAGMGNTIGTLNTYIGRSANASANNFTNATAIGANATVDASNKIQLGNASVTLVNTSAGITAPGAQNLGTNIGLTNVFGIASGTSVSTNSYGALTTAGPATSINNFGTSSPSGSLVSLINNLGNAKDGGSVTTNIGNVSRVLTSSTTNINIGTAVNGTASIGGVTATTTIGGATGGFAANSFSATHVIFAGGIGPNNLSDVTFKANLPVIMSGLTASSLVATDAAKTLTSVPNATGVLTNDGSGVLTWSTAAGLVNFTEAINTAAPNVTVPVASLTATNAATNVDVALVPKGTGALTAQVADNTAAGGGKRGANAVDWQMVRGSSTWVASGQGSVISGGQANTASGTWSVVGGGFSNTASAATSTVAGGYLNKAQGSGYSTVGGGYSNTASGEYSVIPGGSQMTLTGNNSFGFNGNLLSSSRAITISAANVAVFNNVDLWLASNDGTTRALKFFSNNDNAAGAFPVAAKFAAIKAPDALAADITYTLPLTPPTAGQVLSSDAAGVLSWATTGGITGSGTTNTIPKWTSTTAIGNSALTDDGTTLGYGSFFSLTSGQISTLGASFTNSSSNGRIMAITNTDNNSGGGNSRALDINLPNGAGAGNTYTGIKLNVVAGAGTANDILGTGSSWKVTSAGAATFVNLRGAAANKYAEQHAVLAGEIAGNIATIPNSIVAGTTSVVVASLVSGPGGHVLTTSTTAGNVVVTFNAAPNNTTIVNYIVVNP